METIIDQKNKIYTLKRLNKIKNIFICLLFLFFMLCTLVFINKGKKMDIKIYRFTASSDNYELKDGVLVISGDNRYISMSNFNLKNDLNIESMTINIAFNESIWAIKDYTPDSKITPKKWLNELNIYEYGRKSTILDSDMKEDSFIKYRASLFPYDFKIEINYCTDKLCTVEILNIDSEEIETDNKLKK